ncbi:TRM11 family SAM-dependent methyltransferase [Heyndrickxia vini]|uniref:TRM11 family SAM-dependent methyltransferase n=1 Tax=Heyndrickxia vini TaxID=1476025 RepID=UPI001FEAF256|nr:RNA methyltransferase [Heyndrickxia vini]
MESKNYKPISYVYTYAYRDEEQSLCELELRTLFDINNINNDFRIIESSVKINPSRSPFIKERIDVIYTGNDLQDILQKVKELKVGACTFKVIYVKSADFNQAKKMSFEDRRKIEREIGLHIDGEPDLIGPNRLFGILRIDEKWVFGEYTKNDASWLRHQRKPNSYSTALSTRVARSVVNIAVPNPVGTKAIDPCCGIGTVLVEALSMGIDIVGSDRNYLIVPGVRENLAYFGLEGEVTVRDMNKITEKYDVAIIDMPYNLCSVLPDADKLNMLQSARRFSSKLVVITIEEIDDILLEAGFIITDRAIAKKGTFSRHVIVCE